MSRLRMQSMDTAARIKQRMNLLGLKNVDLIRATGISSGGASQWVTGLSQPSGERLLSLAKTLKCSPDWILTGRGEVQDADPAKIKVPVLTSSESISFLNEKSLPEEFRTVDEIVPGTSHVAFGLLEESEQFEPAIRCGAIYYVIPVMASSLKRIGDKMVALQYESHVIVGRIKPMSMGKAVLVMLDGSKVDIENTNKQIIGFVTNIINP